MNNVLLLTTPLVEGMPIERYFGIVTANQVAGTGFLNDLTALQDRLTNPINLLILRILIIFAYNIRHIEKGISIKKLSV